VLDNGNTLTDSDPNITVQNEDDFHIIMIAYDQGGCSDSIEFAHASVEQEIKAKIVNVFTPNSDGANDCIQFVEVRNFVEGCYELTIFNRWGEKLFESYDPDECWNGTVQKNGKPLPEGVYYYVLKASTITANGYIELLGL